MVFISDEDKKRDAAMPQSQEAEVALLGALMYDDISVFYDAKDHISPNDFYNPVHILIAEAIWSRYGMGLGVDAIILKKRFERNGKFDDIGGTEYLALMLNNAPPKSTAIEYAKLLRELSFRRNMLAVCKKAMELITEPDDFTADEIHTHVMSALADVSDHYASADGFVSLKEAGQEFMENQGKEHAMGMSTGIPDLDEAMSGFQRGRLYIGAGRPGMFKSGAGANFCRTIAREGKKVGIFSLEMSAQENATRAMSNALGTDHPVSYQDINAQRTSAKANARLQAVADDLPEILIDETPGITITLLEKRARAMMKEMGGIDFILIDYLQLMGDRDVRQKGDTRAGALTAITSRLKTLCKTLNCSIIALAQVSRSVDSRDNKVPKLADLRDSGSIEQDADVVMMFYRKEYYLRQAGTPSKTADALEHQDALAECEGKMNIILAKNRTGVQGKSVEVIVDLATDTMKGKFDPDPNEAFDLL